MTRTLVLFTLLAVATGVQASTIDVAFTSQLLSGTAGNTLTFHGILTNSGGTDIYLNGAAFDLQGFDPSATDPSAFLLNIAGLLLDGAQAGPADLFTVTIPSVFTPGTYQGTFFVQGGADLAADMVLGSAPFTVQVTANSASASPEPTPLSLLVLAGVALVLAGVRARRTGR